MLTLNDILGNDLYLINTNAPLHRAMKENHNYVTGKQWEDSIRAKLIKAKRPVHTIDLIKPKLNTYSGIERNFRTGWKVSPTESRDEDQAKLINALMIWHNRNHRIDQVASRVFKSGGIDGIGWAECYVRMGKDFMGEIVVRYESGFRIRIDRQLSEPDLSDCPLMSRDRWMTTNNIEKMWPGKKFEPITMDMTNAEVAGVISRETDDYPADHFNDDWIRSNLDTKRLKRRVVDMWERRHVRKKYLLINEGPQKGEVVNLDNFFDSRTARVMWRVASLRAGKKIQIESLQDIVALGESVGFSGFTPFTKVDEEIWTVTFTGGTILNEEKKSPYNHGQFPLIPSFAFMGEREDGLLRASGIVEGLISLQDEKNNNRSKFSDILNHAALGGGWYNKNKGIGQKEIDGIQEPGAYVGLNGPPADNIVERDLKAIPILTHFTSAELQAEADVDKNSGISLPLEGKSANSRESGVAAQTRIKQSMMGLAEPLENHSLFKVTLIKQIISNTQQFIPESKINRIFNSEDLDVPPEAVQQFLQNFATTEFDVTITQGETSDTIRAWMREEIKELMPYLGDQAAVLLPAFIELSDYTKKKDLLKTLSDNQAQLQQQQLEQAGTSGAGPL